MEEFVEIYDSSSQKEKEFYDRKYGKENIERLTYDAEISKFSKKCPSCKIPIQVYFALHSC